MELPFTQGNLWEARFGYVCVRGGVQGVLHIRGLCKGKEKKVKAFIINMIILFYFWGMILKGLQ